MPPTNKAAQLTPSDLPAPATVNRVGPGWAPTVPRSEAFDTALHVRADESMTGQLYEIARQVGEEPLPPKPQPPEPPSLDQLRASLPEALGKKREADAALVAATEALERAQALRSERQATLDRFKYLDGAITDFTVTALRDFGRTDLPPEFHAEISARDRAATDLQAATAAVGVLAAEHGEAASHAAHMAQLAQAAALSIMSSVVVREVVARHRAALAEVEATYIELASFDRFATPLGLAIPFAILGALRDEPKDHRRWLTGPGLDTSGWRDVMNELLNGRT